MAECGGGVSPMYFGFPALGGVILVYQTNRLLEMLSQTTIEGRHVHNMIVSKIGLDRMHIQVASSVLDMFGRFTRAIFVGYILSCTGDDIDRALTESIKSSWMSFMAPLFEALGFGGLTLLSFILGPILIEGGYMMFNVYQLRGNFKMMRRKIEQEGESLSGTDATRQLQVLARWAMMEPIGKLFDEMSLPEAYEDLNDAYRVWKAIKTNTVSTGSRVFCDNILQMFIQAKFLGLCYPNLSYSIIAQTVLNVVLAGADTLGSAVEMIQRNRIMTVGVGFFLLFCMAEPVIRTVCTFVCDSHIVNVMSLSCVPAGLVDYGNFTDAGVTPG